MTIQAIPQGMARHRSGIYVPERTVAPVALYGIEHTPNPWDNPVFRERLRGNDPENLRGVPTDYPGIIAPPHNSLGFPEVIAAAASAGPVKNTFTTAVTALNAQDQITFPANYFSRVGQALRITAAGGLSNIVTTPGTCVFQVMLGPTANIIVYTTGNIQLNATAHTLLPWRLEIIMVLRAIGVTTSANFMSMGRLNGVQFTQTIAGTDNWGRVSAADAKVSDVTIMAPITAPAVSTGFDSTVADELDFWAGFSISNAGNGVTVQQYLVESLN